MYEDPLFILNGFMLGGIGRQNKSSALVEEVNVFNKLARNYHLDKNVDIVCIILSLQQIYLYFYLKLWKINYHTNQDFIVKPEIYLFC